LPRDWPAAPLLEFAQMKSFVLAAALLAISTTSGLCVCKHHVAAPVSVNAVSGTSVNALLDGGEIKKCMPHCGG
jgi:hypothetical protein